jgi:membrane protein DedA with SNARE-associated domain
MLEQILETYGYPALLIGTFFEGETVLVLGGFLAHVGYLKLPWVILFAFIGSICGDQLYFFIGRFKGKAFLEKRTSWQPYIIKAHKLLDRYQILLIIGFRFLYGLRTVTPFVIGMSQVRTGIFIFLNVVGALIWAITIGLCGYLFGMALEALIDDVKKYEIEVILIIIIVGITFWFVRFLKNKRH